MFKHTSNFIETKKIPDSVIFKNSLPCYWFFTNKDGIMKKKSQANLNFENIYNHFCKGNKKSGCCAYLLSEEGSD